MAKIVIDTSDIYTLDEAAQMLGIGIATLFRWMKKQKINPIKLGGRTLITKSEIDRLKGQPTEENK